MSRSLTSGYNRSALQDEFQPPSWAALLSPAVMGRFLDLPHTIGSMPSALLSLWPSVTSAIWGAIWGSLLLCIAGSIAASLARRGWRVGDTRKIFHLMIFTGAGLLRWKVDAGAVVIYGCIVASGILYAVVRGPTSYLFRALARPSDHPYEKLQMVLPLMGTAVGGVLAQLIAGPLAVVAYLVGGWGDAVGEPVGIRWGRHQYRAIGWRELTANRSWEGSAAVFLASFLAASFGLVLSGQTGTSLLLNGLAIAVTAAIVEAASPHGWDNLTLLVAIAGLTHLLVG